MCSEADLDGLLKRHPRVAAAQAAVNTLRTTLDAMPPALKCEDGEVLCLVDSGATISAASIDTQFPAYSHLVEETDASRRGSGATTASGQKLVNKGRCVVHGSAQGTDLNMAFKDMEIEVPILSVRKMVKKGNDVNFEKGGGTIVNRSTGRVLRFYEHDGVYFLKVKVTDPGTPFDSGHEQDFHRQGS